jgi:hypothetical protein
MFLLSTSGTGCVEQKIQLAEGHVGEKGSFLVGFGLSRVDVLMLMSSGMGWERATR